jgi:hypothetical protein
MTVKRLCWVWTDAGSLLCVFFTAQV